MEEVIEKLRLTIKTNPHFEIRSTGINIPMPSGSVYEFDLESQIGTYQNMGATICDSILQAGMNYEKAVKPRITKFRTDYLNTKTTTDFFKIISTQPLEQIIIWKGKKIDRIIALTKFFIKENIEVEAQLKLWLQSEDNVVKLSKLNGIKEKTIDYLKILSGDNSTVAMDIHLQNFIKIYGELPKTLDYKSGKEILLTLAKELKIDPATLDHSIWYFMSQRKI